MGLFWSLSARLSRPLRVLNERLESEVCNCKPCKDSARERGKESAGKRLRWSICGSNQSILSSLNSPGFAARLPEQHGAQRRKRRSSSSRGSCNGTTGEHREPSEHPGGKFSAFFFPLAFLKQSASFFFFFFFFLFISWPAQKAKKHQGRTRRGKVEESNLQVYSLRLAVNAKIERRWEEKRQRGRRGSSASLFF